MGHENVLKWFVGTVLIFVLASCTLQSNPRANSENNPVGATPERAVATAASGALPTRNTPSVSVTDTPVPIDTPTPVVVASATLDPISILMPTIAPVTLPIIDLPYQISGTAQILSNGEYRRALMRKEDDAISYWSMDGGLWQIQYTPQLSFKKIYTPQKGFSYVSGVFKSGNKVGILDYEDGGIWAWRQLDLNTMRVTTLADQPSENQLKRLPPILLPAMRFNERYLVISSHDTSGMDEGKCLLNRLKLKDLVSNEVRVIDETCQQEYYWSIIDMNERYAVIEKDGVSVAKGLANTHNLYLLELASGKMKQITFDGRASMPRMSNEYVVWKVGSRWNQSQSFAIYDLRNGSVKTVVMPTFTDNPVVRSSWIFFTSSVEFIYLYNIDRGKIYRIHQKQGDPNNWFGVANIVGNHLIWVRTGEPSDAPIFLDWRELPD
jgi:hypothetical protein